MNGKKKIEKKMADNIKVVALEADYAVLCRLGLPTSLSLQLQQAGLRLADALWTARASGLLQLKPPSEGERREN